MVIHLFKPDVNANICMYFKSVILNKITDF